MATVTAFIRTLQRVDKNKPANVRFRLRDGRDFQLFHSSELMVAPDKWDNKQQKIKARCLIDEVERNIFDTSVNDRKSLIKSIFLYKGRILTSELLNTEINKALNPEKYEANPEKMTLFQFINKFIDNAPNRKDKKTGRAFSESIVQDYRKAKKHLIDFAVKKYVRLPR